MSRERVRAFVLALAFVLGSGACLGPLRDAKRFYAEGQDYARAMRTDQAIASWKRAVEEAEREVRRRPSAQAFVVKGLAETDLGRFRDAEGSFLKAFSLGFEPGEAWASDVALVGLAVSFEGIGLSDAACRIYGQIVDRSAFKPALMAAAERRTNTLLARSTDMPGEEKARILAGLLKALDRLVDRDFACGLYHYLHAQVDGHLGDLRRAYEESVIARELGLPTEALLRDNDNQIAFAFEKLWETLPAVERDALAAAQTGWARKWGWRDARTPAWKKE